ncbi:ABC transporter permease [Tissierella creatinini]|nr:ABC transporter permease [Tissierella creatinini]TJX63970.1 ABC transporter permease [Soehngenia saccharolytica]
MKLFENYILNINIILLMIIVLGAILAPFVAPYDYNELHLDDIWQKPLEKYLLGTDKLGRDIFTRLLYGGRISLFIALAVEIIAFPIGSILGYISATKSGVLMSLFNRIMEVLFSFPTIILALTLSGIIGVGLNSILVSIAISEIPVYFRHVRTLTLKIKTEPFIEVLTTLGIEEKSIFKDHVLLHLMPPLIPKIIFNFATTIIFESTLSFIGIGIQAPIPSWGNMIRTGLPFIKAHPVLVVSSSTVLAITILLLFGLSEQLEKKLIA